MSRGFDTLVWDGQAKEEGKKTGYRRERSDGPYHSWRWTRLSRAFRASHPICAECERAGRIVPSTCVDHIVPWPICEDFFDEKNLQALCDRCNMVKGNRDKRRIQEWKRIHGYDRKSDNGR